MQRFKSPAFGAALLSPVHSGLLTSAEKEVGDLSTQLLRSQNDERQRIARELHDSTTQHTSTTGFGRRQLVSLRRSHALAFWVETLRRVGIGRRLRSASARRLPETRHPAIGQFGPSQAAS
jgi:hypothetical protein